MRAVFRCRPKAGAGQRLLVAMMTGQTCLKLRLDGWLLASGQLNVRNSCPFRFRCRFTGGRSSHDAALVCGGWEDQDEHQFRITTASGHRVAGRLVSGFAFARCVVCLRNSFDAIRTVSASALAELHWGRHGQCLCRSWLEALGLTGHWLRRHDAMKDGSRSTIDRSYSRPRYPRRGGWRS